MKIRKSMENTIYSLALFNYNMNFFCVLFVFLCLLVSFIGFKESYAFECDNFDKVPLEFSIQGGTVLEICDPKDYTLYLNLNTTEKGNIIVEIPKRFVQPIDQWCGSSFHVESNKGILEYEEKITHYNHMLSISFNEPISEILIGSFVVSETIQYLKKCHDFFITPPKYQLKTGVLLENITCKTGLELVLKSRDDSPACVDSETADELVKRKWGYRNLE